MKKLFLAALAGTAVLGLSACGSSNNADTATSTDTTLETTDAAAVPEATDTSATTDATSTDTTDAGAASTEASTSAMTTTSSNP
jgi:hypothetical protein